MLNYHEKSLILESKFGNDVRQPKGTTAKSAASAPVSAESPVLKVSPAELSRLSNVLVQSVDVTRYYDLYEFDNASLTEGKYYFGGGYVSFHSGGAVEYSAIVSDYRGSTRVVLSAAGGSLQQSVQQLNGYYPSGALIADYQTSHLGGTSSADVQTRKFTGKELDRMHGLDWHDFGARRYDASAVFFTSPDPLSEKYYHINPYVYCAGNPVRFVDPDGRDYTLLINKKTMIVSAIYYTTPQDSESAYSAANFWNEQSSKYIYQINYMSFDIQFDLKVEVVDIPDDADERLKRGLLNMAYESGNKENSNVFCVMPDSEFEENTNGNTSSGVFVRIKESKSMSDTGPHEDGHTLGMTHSFQGIMTAASSDPNRSYTVDKKNLKEMILAPLTGKTNSEDNMPIGKGSVKNMSRYTIDELKNGKIKTKK